MYHKEAILKSHRKKRETVRLYKEDIGCMNPNCSWNGSYGGEILDFHHIDPSTKLHEPARILLSPKQFCKEISKCILLCANCHRLATHDKLDVNGIDPCENVDLSKYERFLPAELRERKKHKKRSGSLSKSVGVTYHKNNKKWQVVIKGKYIGSFHTEAEAALVAKEHSCHSNSE